VGAAHKINSVCQQAAECASQRRSAKEQADTPLQHVARIPKGKTSGFSEEGKIKKLQLTSKPRRCNLETLNE
jgi:hypothetical protein